MFSSCALFHSRIKSKRWSKVMRSATLLLCFGILCVVAKQVGNVGFDAQFPAQTGEPHPHLKTPHDTRTVSPKGPREAQLACVDEGPVRRALNCDIVTWDVCGNIDGARGNISDWRVAVVHMNSHMESRLVSPVFWLQQGVARFYFTPVKSGVHSVKVWRTPESIMPSLNTPALMETLVVIHDNVVKCTKSPVGGIQSQLRRVIWAHSTALNENEAVFGREALSGQPSEIVVDRDGLYNEKDSALQHRVRRSPLQPRAYEELGEPLPDDNSNFNYCDFMKGSE